MTSKVQRRLPTGLLLFVVATVIASAHIGRASLWFDEAFSIDLARMPAGAFWHTLATKEANQSAYFLLLRIWPFHGDVGARSLSALLTGATAPLLWGLGRRLFDERTGLLAALLFAVLPFTLQASQEARGYSLLMLAATAASYLLIRACASGGFWWGAYVLSAGLLPYVHFFGLFVLVAHALWLFAVPEALGRGLQSLGLATGLAAPMLVFFTIHHDAAQVAWLHRPHWAAVAEGFDAIGTRFWVGAAAVGLALVGIALGARSHRRATLLVGLWLLTGPVLAIGYSLAVAPIYQVRYLAGQAPAMALLVAVILDRVGRRSITIAVLAGLLVVTRGHHGPLVHEDWRSADALLRQEFRSGDQVMTFPSYLAPAASVYGHGSYGEVDPVTRPATADRVWVLSFGRVMPTPAGYAIMSSQTPAGFRLTLLVRVTPPADR